MCLFNATGADYNFSVIFVSFFFFFGLLSVAVWLCGWCCNIWRRAKHANPNAMRLVSKSVLKWVWRGAAIRLPCNDKRKKEYIYDGLDDVQLHCGGSFFIFIMMVSKCWCTCTEWHVAGWCRSLCSILSFFFLRPSFYARIQDSDFVNTASLNLNTGDVRAQLHRENDFKWLLPTCEMQEIIS